MNDKNTPNEPRPEDRVAAGVSGGAAGAGAQPTTPTPTPAPTPIPTRPEPAASWVSGVKELMAALIAAVIVAFALLAFWKVFVVAGQSDVQPETFQRQRDIMLYGLTLLGTVLGYYFGRVPAERRAERAETAVENAQVTASQSAQSAMAAQQAAGEEAKKREAAERKVVDSKQTVAAVEAALQVRGFSAEDKASTPGGQIGAPPNNTADALAELRALSRRL